ncbi:MAG: hypothetical protein FWC71_04340 [Defluviitaleaceae bacterium]|nr:hypothetical protein [Defluviitaleaceae bacterium]
MKNVTFDDFAKNLASLPEIEPDDWDKKCWRKSTQKMTMKHFRWKQCKRIVNVAEKFH